MKFKSLLILFIACCMIACSPNTKEDYIQEFETFIESVDDAKIKDWSTYDEKFKKFNGELYKKFESEMSMMDKVKVNAYRVRYNVKRHKSGILDAIVRDGDIKKAREEINYYIEHGMQEDVDKFVKEAEKVSEEFGKAVREIADQLEEELQDK